MVEQAFSKKVRNENFEVNLSKLDASQRAAVESTEENVVIRASAGSGKTSTLITAIAAYRYENINDRICAITYTRAAKDEMIDRLQSMGIYDVEVSTIHVWSRNMLEQLALKYDFKIRLMEAPDIKTILEEITTEYRLRRGNKMRINIDILYSYITGNKNMDITDGYKRTLNALEELYIEYKRDNNLYDFTDLPLYLYDVMVAYNEFVYDVDALFVDEFQDVDEVQFETFRRVLTKKKFFIGDGWQCQPEGSQIMIRSKEGSKTIPIEEIEVGTPIVYYDQGQGYVSGSKLPHNALLKTVKDIQKHTYMNDYLITIETENGLKSSYTSNHRTFVRFNKKEGYHVVYLMCDSNYRFRVGKIPMFYSGKTDRTCNPWRDKMRAEGCEKLWLLKVFDNDHDARVEETKISYQYGIPQTCWQTQKVQWTVEDINYIYSGLDTKKGAKKCLEDYKLNIDYPLLDDSVEWSKRSHFTSNASSEIYAINIMPEFMSCLCYGSSTNHKNLHAETIVRVDKKFIDLNNPINVYALKTDGETYVADGIITHNSIYVFRGADGEVFDKLNEFDLYKLKYNYRSYQEIIDYAATVYQNLKYRADIKDSYIAQIDHSDPCSIHCSRGYGGSVTVFDAFGNCNKIENMVNSNIGINEQQSLFNSFVSKNPMILCRTNKQVKAIQEFGYSNVSTVHQAKGLEYDNVIVIDTAIRNLEDLNIAYVALTRARDEVMVMGWNTFEAKWRSKNNLWFL